MIYDFKKGTNKKQNKLRRYRIKRKIQQRDSVSEIESNTNLRQEKLNKSNPKLLESLISTLNQTEDKI